MKTRFARISIKIFHHFALLLFIFSFFNFKIFIVQANAFKEYEREDLRTPSSKTFQIGENKFRTIGSANKLHYFSGNRYHDINNNVVEIDDANYNYKNISNSFTFKAGDSLEKGVEISTQDKVCQFKLSSIESKKVQNSIAQIKENKIIYPDIYKDADLEFTVLPDMVMTEIVAKNPAAFKKNYGFELTNCDENIFSKPTISDERDIVEISQKVIKEKQNKNLKESREKKVLLIEPDYTKLGKIDGEVRIDPSINFLGNPSVDVFASDLCPGNNRRFLAFGDWRDSATDVYCGRAESYLKFDLPDLNGMIVEQSRLNLYRYQTDYGGFDVHVAKILENSLTENTGANLGEFLQKSSSYTTKFLPQGNNFTDGDFYKFDFDVKSIISEWTSDPVSNYGFAIYADSPAGSNLGAAVCSSRYWLQPYCNSSVTPTLEITYYLNQPPNIPNPISPISQQEFSGDCDESANPISGICGQNLNINFTANGVGDNNPSPGDLDYSIFTFRGANNFTTDKIYGQPNIIYQAKLGDGETFWKVKSVDKLGLESQYSNEFSLISDTTPPLKPVTTSLALYSSSLNPDGNIQITVSSNKVTDNISLNSDISYQLTYSDNPNFTSNSFTKNWQKDNSTFQISSIGADGVKGTADDLKENIKYYFKIKAKDKLGNTSNWSNVVSTTLDATKPDLYSFTSDEVRFSPNNSTSLGIKDKITFGIKFNEANFKETRIEIYKNTNRSQSIKSFKSTSKATLNFIWNGKDNSQNYVGDGAYLVVAEIEDLAGNVSTQKEVIVIVDNTGSSIFITSPFSNYWTNLESIQIRGQVGVPHVQGKEDQDIQKLEIIKSEFIENISFDNLGFFESTQNLSDENNNFTLKTTDTVGNTETKILSINKETTKPEIFNITPSTLINDKQPEIKFSVKDFNSSLYSGLDLSQQTSNTKISLIYKTSTGITLFTKDLVVGSKIVDKTLVNKFECTPGIGNIKESRNNIDAYSAIDCLIHLGSNLNLDGKYFILIETEDIAGNRVINDSTNFILDTHLFSELSSPKNNQLFSTKSIKYLGKSDINSKISIRNENLNREKTFTINQNLDGIGRDLLGAKDELLTSNFTVKCDQFICVWKVDILQQSSTKNENIENLNIFKFSDEAGNSNEHKVNTLVNLYALNLSITADLNYISPNNDGKQDFVTFTNSLTDNLNVDISSNINSYEILIKDEKGNIKHSWAGSNILPSKLRWDGKHNYAVLPDGKYFYSLSIRTKDNILLMTNPQTIYVKTVINNEVIITSPKTGFVTTDGIVTVQGLAPLPTTQNGKVMVDFCIDILDYELECDLKETVLAQSNGFFSTLITLPFASEGKDKYEVWAIARDEFGNSTKKSNIVRIIKDIQDPFKGVWITPALTGINTKEDYEKFLRGEIPISKIKTLLFGAEVTKNTEEVAINFAEFTNLLEKPKNFSFNKIALVNNKKEENFNLNPYKLDSIKYNHRDKIESQEVCLSDTCFWQYYFAVPNNFAGKYEVEFKAKKGTKIQNLNVGFQADGSIPSTPILFLVDKWDNEKKNWIPINLYEGKYYTNSTKLRLRGAADPNTKLLFSTKLKNLGETTSSELGIWEFTFDINNNFSECSNFDTVGKCLFAEFPIDIVALRRKGNNITNKSKTLLNYNFVYDVLKPEIISLKKLSPNSEGWIKSGTKAGFEIVSNEELKYSDIVKEDNFIVIFSRTNAKTWTNKFNIDRKNEGKYYTKIRLIDLAGNINIYDASKVTRFNMLFYIDNTSPKTAEIVRDGWDRNGVKANENLPNKARLTSGYVVRSKELLISGYLEKDQRVEVFVNNKKLDGIFKTDFKSCKKQEEDLLAKDKLIVRSGTLCRFEWRYTFPDSGENDEFGIPYNSYNIQMRVIDKAQNISKYSENILIYHDSIAPTAPEISA